MAKGNRTGIKNNRRRIQQREKSSEESDEEYMVTEDEECESDEYCSLDGEESEEILADFEKTRRVARSRNTRKTSSSNGNELKKPRKKRAEDDDDEEYEVDDEDKAEFLSLGRKGYQIKKPLEKKRVSYTEVDDDDEVVYLGRKGNRIKKLRETSRVSYTEEDEDDEEFASLGRKGYQKKKLCEKRKVVYTGDDDEDESEFTSSSRKGNWIKKLQETSGVSYTEEEEEEDDAEFLSLGRKGNQKKKLRGKRKVVCTEDDDEDDSEFMSSSRKGNRIKKLQETSRVSYTEEEEEEEDEDDAEFLSLGRKGNQKKKLRGKRKVVYTEDDDEDDSEFTSSSRKGNRIKKLQETSRVSYTEEDEEEDDDEEFMSQKKNIREKRKIVYTEDDDEDDSEFTSSSKKANQIKKPQEKKTVSHKEEDEDEDEEEEDENDEEFMLSESDFFDDEDESPKVKKNEKVSKYHPQKKNIGGGRKKKRNSKSLKKPKPTRPNRRNRKFSRKKLDSSNERAVTSKTHMEKQSKKTSRGRKRRVVPQSDSDFVSSASSDHDYTISEEEREQMREARVYCANLRAKLRSSSCGKQEEDPIYEQRKYPMRKGKEKVEDMKEEIGKQVCGICLSEEGKRTVRGVLNCCRHYFCFSCIMEWSKVESRCPLCKQRFTTITKAAKSDKGFDSRTVVIPVPECDQVYQPSEEELRGYLDPYESVICTECHHGGDDALMLLCDICDSPAHTFCVGLGREVPEDNWYCEGCRPTVFGSLSSQRPTPTPDRRLSSNPSDLSSPVTGGFDLNELYVPETPLTEQTRVPPEPRPSFGDFIPAGSVATTLRDRRRIHRQIHHRFLNNNRSSGTSAYSSGVRLFGSQLDHTITRDSTPRREDHVIPSMLDTNLFSPRTDQFDAQMQNSPQTELVGSAMAFDSRSGYAQLHPCTNRSSIGSDANRLHMRAERL